LRRGIIFCQRSTAGTKQSRPGAHCSCLKNSKGNGRISLRLFITSQPCRRNSEFFIKWKYLQQRACSCNLLHNNRIIEMACSFTCKILAKLL
jgi:hypothetical protein